MINYECEEYARSTWGPIVTRLNEENAQLKRENSILWEFKEKADRFDILIAHLENNDNIKGYWNKILMLMQLEQN